MKMKLTIIVLLALFAIGSASAQYNTRAIPRLSRVPERDGFCRIKLVSADQSACFVYVSDLAPMVAWQKRFGHSLDVGVAFVLRVPDGLDVTHTDAARLALRNAPWVNAATVVSPPWDRQRGVR